MELVLWSQAGRMPETRTAGLISVERLVEQAGEEENRGGCTLDSGR